MAFEHQVIRVKGSPFERGVAYGEQAKERILRTLSLYQGMVAANAHLDWESAKKVALRFEESIKGYFPDAIDEMKGIAQGADLTYEDVLALNCRSELMFALPDGCTAISYPPETTADGHTVLTQTWDWLLSARACTVVLEIDQAPLPRILMVVEAGMIGGKGLNEDGIGVTLNALSVGKGQVGVPLHVMYRKILSSKLLSDAIECVGRCQRAGAGNFNIGSACGIVASVEYSPDNFSVMMSEGEPLCHANHYLSPLFIADDKLKFQLADTFVRYNRAQVLTQGKRGFTIKTMFDVMSNHDNFPDSLCSHPDPRDPDMLRMCTVYAVAFDLNDRVLWVTNGNACEGPAYPFRFTA